MHETSIFAANDMSNFTRRSTPYLLKYMSARLIIRKQIFKRCRAYVMSCMHRRKHFRETRSEHLKTAFLVVTIYSVVFVDHNLVDDGH